jgi:hypothetical protein
MKIHLLAAMLPGIAMATPDDSFQAPALLIGKTGGSREIQLIEVAGNSFRYRAEENSSTTSEGRLPEDGTLHPFEPPGYSAAMDLYQARKYTEAKAAFIAVKDRFQPIQSLEGGPVAMAAFHEMECLRKLGDLNGLAAALQNFPKGALTRETQLRQLELYVLWDAVRTMSWELLETLAGERANTRLPGDQRAQVEYCHGLALEGLNRPDEALAAYQAAMTADSGASEEITRQAALRILAIHKANPAVLSALKLRASGKACDDSMACADLAEAAAVAGLFELSLGAGTPLPAEFRLFLKYRP